MKVDIIMTCPVCLSEGHNAVRDYWLHEWPCKGRLTLDENAIVQCRKCRRSEKLTKMLLKCNSGRHKFKVASTEGLAAAISCSAQMVNQVTMAWLNNVIQQL